MEFDVIVTNIGGTEFHMRNSRYDELNSSLMYLQNEGLNKIFIKKFILILNEIYVWNGNIIFLRAISIWYLLILSGAKFYLITQIFVGEP